MLLDEVEKAHPRVFDLYLQLFDEGRITDAKGRTADAGNCIIIMTSNIRGAKTRNLGFGAQDNPIEEEFPDLKKFFRPELLNRIDEQILFRELDKDDIRCILTAILDEVRRNLHARHNVGLTVTPEVVDYLAENGYSPEYGVRELRRVVERELETKIAERLMGELETPAELTVVLRGGNVVIA
jgi:ATP-dependent Clp protease ATP-binding subunit ClpA